MSPALRLPLGLSLGVIAVVLAAGGPARANLAPTPAEIFADLTKRAGNGETQAEVQLGWAYMNGDLEQKKDEVEGAKWIAKAAEAGDAQSQYDLAQFYRTGRGVNPDFAEALDWTEKAADQGRVEAIAYICNAYTQDPTVNPDWDKALPYCFKASRKGDQAAIYALGLAYADGISMMANSDLALKYLGYAADHGSGKAHEKLGDIYAGGQLVPEDDATAFDHYRKAARAGSTVAILAMAKAYDTGKGVTTDTGEAARLYDILARSGNDDAQSSAQSSAKAWFDQHPDIKRDDLAANIITIAKIPRDTIFYAVDGVDPRFLTQDMSGYFDTLMKNSYPEAAQDAGKSGDATVECRFTPLGEFDDCILVEESPTGLGFGDALMFAADRLQFSGNKTDWQARYAGKILRLQMMWKK